MNDIVINVINNVVSLTAVILVGYAVVYVLERIIDLITHSFAGFKLFNGWLKKMRMSGFGIRRKLEE